MDLFAQSAGGLLVALVALSLVVDLYRDLRRTQRESEERRLTGELLRVRIEAAKALRKKREQETVAWNGYRKFVVDRKVVEADGVCSFYLVPHDRKPLPSFKPGQYLTFQADLPDHEEPERRCYSLSDGCSPDYYRVTIKRVGPPPGKTAFPPGLVSNLFHDRIHERDILDVKAPSGKFFLDPEGSRPAVLIGGGVGITPLASMARTLATLGDTREVWLFYGVRNGAEHILKQEWAELTAQHPNIKQVVFYSKPSADDVAGRDYDVEGRVSLDAMKQYLKTSNYEYFTCGPSQMMEMITQQLGEWGVPARDIHFEEFGPPAEPAPAVPVVGAEAGLGFKIVFSKTGRELSWTGAHSHLFQFATANQIKIKRGCLRGKCGKCETAIVRGEVEYIREPEYEYEKGCCLPCVCKPVGDIEINA